MKRLPTLTPKKVAQALERRGFVLQRIKGSHHCYKYPSKPEIKVVVPFQYTKVMAVFANPIIIKSFTPI